MTDRSERTPMVTPPDHLIWSHRESSWRYRKSTANEFEVGMVLVNNAVYVGGRRSADPRTLDETYEILRERHGYKSALSLRGGMRAWAP